MKQPKRIKIVINKIKNKNIIEKSNYIDKDLEFDAPKKINLKNLENYDRNELEKWFEEDHSDINENLYAKKKKRKFSEFKKEFKIENEKINLKRKFSMKIRDEFLTKKLNEENFNGSKENIHSKKEIKKETHNFNEINNNVNSYLENNEKIIKEEKEDNEINNINVENEEKNNIINVDKKDNNNNEVINNNNNENDNNSIENDKKIEEISDVNKININTNENLTENKNLNNENEENMKICSNNINDDNNDNNKEEELDIIKEELTNSNLKEKKINLQNNILNTQINDKFSFSNINNNNNKEINPNLNKTYNNNSFISNQPKKITNNNKNNNNKNNNKNNIFNKTTNNKTNNINTKRPKSKQSKNLRPISRPTSRCPSASKDSIYSKSFLGNNNKSNKTKIFNNPLKLNRNYSGSNINNNTLYVPRMHNEKILKKWEKENNKNWYNLSPNSRIKANEEMSKFLNENKN